MKIRLLIITSIILSQNVFTQVDKSIVEVTKINPNIILDIRYATENNFLKEIVYPEARCFMRYKAAVKLDSIQKELETIGLGLKIFDGYRPLSVQKKMWEVYPDDRYVANPKNGSRHNRGAAVDLTLVDSLGNDLKMPTDYDSFSEKAHHSFISPDKEIMRNRWILKTIMQKYGFKTLKTEWWHYDLIGWQEYEIMDVSFDEL
ncbi:MAG: peptidase M15 [Calditrichaeota bacterium]|nr:MAG: peptidase M15 [Calditrichota bacterium]MBL1204856.1 peptidase M15 [Calditrichota bacterium]NOG44685.1 M15 family metallopeptidase [Calditrichota bacterium]